MKMKTSFKGSCSLLVPRTIYARKTLKILKKKDKQKIECIWGNLPQDCSRSLTNESHQNRLFKENDLGIVDKIIDIQDV